VSLEYAWNASFTLYLSDRDRFARVHVTPDGPDGHSWRMSVTCFDRGREPGGLIRNRVRVPADTPPDPVAPLAAYEVALVLHRHLSTVARELMWALDRSPTQNDSHDAPVPPPPT